jgi:prefoldin subunit 5
MKQLEAVVPQYRAAAQSLQGQVTLLKERLAAAQRERATLQEEASVF